MSAHGPDMLVRRDDFVRSCAEHAHQAGETKMKETQITKRQKENETLIYFDGKLQKPNCHCHKATVLSNQE